MTIKLGEVALSPGKYQAYTYRFTNLEDGKQYVGYHVGSTVDKYKHSSTSKEFKEAFSNPESDFQLDILGYGTKERMLQLEYETLTASDARNNPLFYNKTNGQQQYATIDLNKVKDLIKQIDDGRYPKVLEDIQDHVDMPYFQVRFEHDDKHQKEITQAVDLADGDTINCFGDGNGLRVIIFEGRSKDGQPLRVDGNHSVFGAARSSHCTKIAVIRIPYEVNKTLNDAEMRSFSNILNPRPLVRRKETDVKTGIKFVKDCYEINGIPHEAQSNVDALKAMGFAGSQYKGKINDIITKAKDLSIKDEGDGTGRIWVNYKANPHKGVVDAAVARYNGKEGWCAMKCSSAYYRLDRAMEEIYKANKVLEDGDQPVTNCRVYLFHPDPSTRDKWRKTDGPYWKSIEDLTVSKNVLIEVKEMPEWQEDD